MRIKSDDLLKIHLPRWEEFPDFELYIEQVIGFINDKLAVFNINADEPLITPSMINNYVKNGVLHPPVKKKYNREHLAKLFIICIGKRMLSISDLKESINAMMRVFRVSEGYNIFCDELEYEILSSAYPEEYPERTVMSAPSRDVATLRSLASAVAKILLFDRIIAQRKRISSLAARMIEENK